jgi:anti-sigma B factor antagonist
MLSVEMGKSVLKVTVRNRGEIAVFRCMGRMIAGEDARALWDGIRNAAGKRLVVLDLAEVDAIDAAGLGFLIFLHTSASIGGMDLKLINPTQRNRKLLVLTNLDSVLEICSPQDVEWRPSGAEHAHAGFNARDIEAVLAALHEDVVCIDCLPPSDTVSSSRTAFP